MGNDREIIQWDKRLADQVERGWDNYKHLHVDLSTARLDEPFVISGEYLYVEESSGAAAIAKIKLNRNTNDALDLEKGVKIETIFIEIFITNEAIEDGWLDLVSGINFKYKKKIAEVVLSLFGAAGCVNVTPRFDFTAGQVWVLVNNVFVKYLVSGVEDNIALAPGQNIKYISNDWDSVTRIDIRDDKVSGDISGWILPNSLLYFYVMSTLVFGNISELVLPNSLVNFFVRSTALDYDLSNGAFTGITINLNEIDFDNCLLTWQQVDNVLVDCVASGITSVPNPKTLDLAGTNAVPSAAGLLDVGILIARGWAVTHS